MFNKKRFGSLKKLSYLYNVVEMLGEIKEAHNIRSKSVRPVTKSTTKKRFGSLKKLSYL